jgi:hypothetical protein
VNEAFDFLRGTIGSRPLWIWLGLLPVAFAVRRWTRLDASRGSGRFVHASAVAALFYYAALVSWYAVIPQQSDNAEPTISCVAWLFRLGQPVYHTLVSAERYAHIYGPMAFVLPGVALGLFGPTMFVAKAIGVFSALCAIALTWLSVRGTAPSRVAAAACGICVLECLAFRNLSFWSRPDPLQLLAVAMGLFAATRLAGGPAIVIMSLAAGVLWNLKITGPLYSLPIFAMLYARAGTRVAAWSAAGAVIVAALPFVVFPNVSWTDYLLWVRLSARNGLRAAAFKDNIQWAVFLLVPLLARLATRRPLTREMTFAATALVIGVSGVVVAAAKPGAGAYHLAPFLPTVAYLYAAFRFEAESRRLPQPLWQVPFIVTLLVVGVIQQQYFFRIAVRTDVAASYADVRRYLEQHPDRSVAVGYTSDERMTFARTLAVFASGRYLIDAPAVQEHELSGVELPPATYEAIRSCAVETWLIPRGGRPFDIRNDYPATGHRNIFPAEFITAFETAYRLDGHTAFYDVWRCRTR